MFEPDRRRRTSGVLFDGTAPHTPYEGATVFDGDDMVNFSRRAAAPVRR